MAKILTPQIETYEFSSRTNFRRQAVVTGDTFIDLALTPGKTSFISVRSFTFVTDEQSLYLTTQTDTAALGIPLQIEDRFNGQMQVVLSIDSEARIFGGNVKTANANGNILIDNGVDFVKAGVRIGDRLRNVTDGSYTDVLTVTDTRLGSTGGGLVEGSDNEWAVGDEYRVDRVAIYANPGYSGLGDTVTLTITEF